MNSRLFISQSQKSYCNNHKADTRYGRWQNFPFCSKIYHVNAEQYKQGGSNCESRILFHLKWFGAFLFSKEPLSSEKINCYENIFPPRFSLHDGIGRSICISIEVKRYLRSKKRNVYTPCLFLAKEFR